MKNYEELVGIGTNGTNGTNGTSPSFLRPREVHETQHCHPPPDF